MENNINNFSLVQTSEQENINGSLSNSITASEVNELTSIKNVSEIILETIDEIKDSYFEIGNQLSEIKDFKIYQLLGYTDFYDYCEKVFGFKKTFTSNLISVSQKFKIEEFEGSSISTLIELLPLSENKKLCNELKNSTVKEIRETKSSLNKIDSTLSDFLMEEYRKLHDSFELQNDCISDFAIVKDSFFGYKVTFSYAVEVFALKKVINFDFIIVLKDDTVYYRIKAAYESRSLCDKLVYHDKIVSNYVYDYLKDDFYSLEEAKADFLKVETAVALATKLEKKTSSLENVSAPKKSSRGLTNDKKRDEYLQCEENWELVNELSSEDIIVRKLTVKKTYYVVYFKGNFKLDLLFYKYESYYDKGKISISYLNSASTIVSEMKEVGY